MIASTIAQIRTPRLLLTRMEERDFADLHCMYSDPLVTATLGGVRTAEQTRVLFDKHLAHWDQHGFGWWLARERASGHFAGRGGLRYNTVGGREEIELSYGFMSEFWGRRLATELAAES